MKVIGHLSSSAIAVFPAPLQYRAIQKQQILELSFKKNLDSQVTLVEETRKELQWWIQNLHLSNGRALVAPPPQLIISSDVSIQGCIQQGSGCSSSTLDSHSGVCFSTFLLNRQGFMEGSGRSGNNSFNHSSLAKPSVVSSSITVINPEPNLTTSLSRTIVKSSGVLRGKDTH